MNKIRKHFVTFLIVLFGLIGIKSGFTQDEYSHLKFRFTEQNYISTDGLPTYCLSVFLFDSLELPLRSLNESSLLNHNMAQFDLKIFYSKYINGFINFNNAFIETLAKIETPNNSLEIFCLHVLSTRHTLMRNQSLQFSHHFFEKHPQIRTFRLFGDHKKPNIKFLDKSINPLSKLRVFTMENIYMMNYTLPCYFHSNGFIYLQLNFGYIGEVYLDPKLEPGCCLIINGDSMWYLSVIINTPESDNCGEDIYNFQKQNIECIRINGEVLKTVIFYGKDNKINVNILTLVNQKKTLESLYLLNGLPFRKMYSNVKIRNSYYKLTKLDLRKNDHLKIYSRCLER